jgi:hypothetical protein
VILGLELVLLGIVFYLGAFKMSEKHELKGIEHWLERIFHLLERRFGLKPATQILIIGENMAQINLVPGGAVVPVQLVPLPSGSVFDSPADLVLTCDDSAVVIVPHPGDTTGSVFDVSAPASDLNTSANLDATALAGGKQIAGSVAISIGGAPPPPPNAATSIGIVPFGASSAAGSSAQGEQRPSQAVMDKLRNRAQ